MRHSSGPSTPETFRGFALCIAAVLAGHLTLIGALGYSIKQSLDEIAVASISGGPGDTIEVTGSIGDGASRAPPAASRVVQ